MNLIFHRLTVSGFAVLLGAIAASCASAQITAAGSGVPGDGIPDVYYWPESGLVAPNGEVRDAGFLMLDTDGTDFAALLISDPDEHFFIGCILCDGGVIPDPTLPPPGFHAFTVGAINGCTQWVRTFPLQGTGPTGIIDLAQGPGGLMDEYFVEKFDDTAPEALWSFRYATDSSGQFFSNITVLPEPGCASLLSTAMFGMLMLRPKR